MAPGTESRSKALDGLRGLAVLQVVIYHYYLLQPIDTGWYRTLQRLGNVLDGVTLFFVLSGFLIGGILLDTRGTPGMFRVFYRRRACRILPLYCLLLATYGVVRLMDERWHFGFIYYWYAEFPFWSYLVFWQNNTMTQYAALGAPWLAVTWSLAVEQQFYLIAPWVIRYVADRRVLLALCAGGMLAGSLHRFNSIGLPVLLIDRLDALAAGVALAIILRSAAGRELSTGGRRALRLLVTLYVAALLTLRVAGITSPVIDNLLTASLMYALLIRLVVDVPSWWPVKPVLQALAPIGLWSYFIYLFHLPVEYLFQVFLPGALGAALPVTAGLAALSYRYFEEPLIRWGHRLKYHPAEQPAVRL